MGVRCQEGSDHGQFNGRCIKKRTRRDKATEEQPSRRAAAAFWSAFPDNCTILVPFFSFRQDIQQDFLLESFYALIILLMEIPSGYFADRYGRAMVLRAGGLLLDLCLGYR